MIDSCYMGDTRDGLRAMIAAGIRAQTCVTSPPYWGLRDYGTAEWDGGADGCDHKQTVARHDGGRVNVNGFNGSARPDSDKGAMNYRDECGKCGARRIDKQIGLEPTPAEYVANMVEVFRLVRDVLADDGTLWLNLGDSYAANGGGGAAPGATATAGNTLTGAVGDRSPRQAAALGLKPKDLVGIPWRVAFALQDDGWYLRSDIIWHKPNPMPESVTDRPTKAHEYLFLLAKSERYYYDAAAIAEAASDSTLIRAAAGYAHGGMKSLPGRNDPERFLKPFETTRNRRTVWSIATQPYADAHFAVMPRALVEPCVLAGTSAKGHCPACGKGWARVVERSPGESASPTSDYGNGAGRNDGGRSHLTGASTQTLGWQPSCDCNAGPPVPGVVLDPFLGSGTVAQVAQDLGRRWIGCELNPEYVEMQRRRTAQQGLILDFA